MFYLPPLRRFFLPATVLLAFIVFYRSKLLVPISLQSLVIHRLPLQEAYHVPMKDLKMSLPATNISNNHLSPPKKYFYSYNSSHDLVDGISNNSPPPFLNTKLEALFKCSRLSNPYTNHIRLPNIIQNISHIPPDPLKAEHRIFWNPTIISLPYWSENQYLVVSRVVTDGNYQENVLCEANVCYVGSSENAKPGEKLCTADDIKHLGPAGGMRCASAPVALSVPPTPAESCQGKYASYVDIPGFHDPRIFWSGKGEPLMMVNTQ